MRHFFKSGLVAILISALMAGASTAQQLQNSQEIDKNTVNELVQQEVKRIFDSEEFDAAVARAIQNFITTQRQAQQQAQMEQQNKRIGSLRPVDPAIDHIAGEVDAPVTLVEYSDFECPFCKRLHPTVTQLLDDNPGKLRWVYRHFPLGFHNPGALKQAEATECVAELQGNAAFWQYSDLIYQRTSSNGNGFPLTNLQPLAVEIGVDGEAFAACMESGRMTARVQQDIDNGVAIGVSGTPTVIVQNESGETRIVSGARPLSELQGIVDALAPSSPAE